MLLTQRFWCVQRSTDCLTLAVQRIKSKLVDCIPIPKINAFVWIALRQNLGQTD